MKKVLCILLVIISIFNISFYTVAGNETDITNNIETTDDSTVYTSGLIVSKSVSVGKDSTGRNLIITATTDCVLSVVKCGISKMVIQRRQNSNYSWETYTTYEDFYVDTYAYTLRKSLYAPTGFDYRVITTHYAKKSIFAIQTGDATSVIIRM